MTVHVENWAMCDDCGFPRLRMPDGKRCAGCRGTNLRRLIALKNDRTDGGLMSLRDIARTILPKNSSVDWVINLNSNHRTSFPKPVIISSNNRPMYDFDEVEDWIYAYAAEPLKWPATNKLTLDDLPPRPPVVRRKPAEEKLPTVEELCLDSRPNSC